jgi:hypothetical protein
MGSRKKVFYDARSRNRRRLDDKVYRNSFEYFMKEMLDKLKNLIKSLESERGSLLISALFLTEGFIDKWDFILAADWLNPRELSSYKIVSEKLQAFLTENELLQLSRIVILDPNDPVVNFLLELEPLRNGGYKEFSGEDLTEKFKFVIKRAYLLRSQGTQNLS